MAGKTFYIGKQLKDTYQILIDIIRQSSTFRKERESKKVKKHKRGKCKSLIWIKYKTLINLVKYSDRKALSRYQSLTDKKNSRIS